jgi:hypothetical protein
MSHTTRVTPGRWDRSLPYLGGVAEDFSNREILAEDFSDREIQDIELVARAELEEYSEAGWTLAAVRRRPNVPGQAEIVVNSPNHEPTVVLIDRSEFAEHNPANGSQLSEVGFNVSVRLMEFNGIRGFDAFAGQSEATLELYPPDREVLPPLPEGHTRHLRHPFYRDPAS